MKSSASKIQVAGFNDLFQQSGAEVDAERTQEVPLSELFPFKGHPFQVWDDEAMGKMAESIAKYGVLVPGIVRPRPEGGYELVSGHRRKRGSELAGKDTMPVLVRTLDDDEATIIMVDSNLQREKILPSEKAFAYQMKLEALKHQGKRRELTSAHGVPNLTAREIIAQDAGEKSGMTITRYIALTKLIPPLLAMVDEDKLAVSVTADFIAVLPQNEQTDLFTVMNKLNVIPAKSQLVRMKQYSKDGTLTITVIDAILSETKPVLTQFTLKKDRLQHYFPPSYTSSQIEEVIISLLDGWTAHNMKENLS